MKRELKKRATAHKKLMTLLCDKMNQFGIYTKVSGISLFGILIATNKSADRNDEVYKTVKNLVESWIREEIQPSQFNCTWWDVTRANDESISIHIVIV